MHTLWTRVGHGNGKEKATARANLFACLCRVAGNKKQQISSVPATLFFCRQQNWFLSATKKFAGNKIGFHRQQESLPETKSNLPALKKATLPATKTQIFRQSPNNFVIFTLAG